MKKEQVVELMDLLRPEILEIEKRLQENTAASLAKWMTAESAKNKKSREATAAHMKAVEEYLSGFNKLLKRLK